MTIKKFFSPTLSLALLLTLCALLAYLSISAKRKTDDFYRTMPANAYINDTLGQKNIDVLMATIGEIEGVEKVLFISKPDAAKKFYKKTEVDVNKMFKTNPLPQSFEVYFVPRLDIAKPVKAIAKLSNIDDVDAPTEAFDVIEKQATQIFYYAAGFLALFILTVIYVLYSLSRIEVAASVEFIDGAKQQRWSPKIIRKPFMDRALNNAVVAGVMASAFTFIATDGIATFFPSSMLTLEMELLGMIFATTILAAVVINTLFTFWAVNRQIYTSN